MRFPVFQILLASVVMIVPTIAALAAAPAMPGQPTIAVIAPWAPADRIIRDAGGVLLPQGSSAFPVAVFDAPALVSLATRKDVWLLLDGAALQIICGE